MITLHYNNTTLDIQEDDSSYRLREIMGENSVTLIFALDRAIEFPVGTYIVFQNCTYTLTSPMNWKRQGKQHIEYTLVLDGPQVALGKYRFRNMQDGRLVFSMCATPDEFLTQIIGNLNSRTTGWTKSTSLTTASAKTVEFNQMSVMEALQAVADAFETEWEITEAKQVRLGKVEYYKSSPITIKQGKNSGFREGTGRSTVADSGPIDILYVQGGERNIDKSTYGSKCLLLPKNKTFTIDGKTYQSSADGLSLQRVGVAGYGNEGSIDLSDIYPKRVGTISSVVVVDAENHFYDIVDSSIPSDLNYNDVLIAGETMTVIFQTGMLAGKEFQISKYIHAEDGQAVRRFELVPQEIDGQVMPGGTYLPAVGDTYIVFGCTLPAAYISNESDHTGAEWEMFKEAARYLAENGDYKFTYQGELQSKYARDNWVNIGGKLILGGYVHFVDDELAPLGVDIRITSIKDFLGDPYSPTITISNSQVGRGISSTLKKPDANEVKIIDAAANQRAFTKRSFADAKETAQMLISAALEGFDPSISPIAIQTMQLLVGDESLQFKFWTNRNCTTPIANPVSYNPTTKQLSVSACAIQHMTLGISTVKSSHTISEYLRWTMDAYISATLAEPAKKYYLYAKVDSANDGTSHLSGEFVMSETSIPMRSVNGYYHLLVGMLMSEKENDRSFAPMFGFTEILPGQITTDRIATGNGNSFIDLLGNAARLGGANSSSPYLEWNTDGQGKLNIHGALNVDGGGNSAPAIVPRGAYDAAETYYWGNVVEYLGSSYMNIYELSSTRNVVPTDTTRWKKYISKGDPGQDGQDGEDGSPGADGYNNAVVRLYKRSATAPSIDWQNALNYDFTTGLLSSVPSGWSQSVPVGTDPLYMTAASAVSNQTTDTIAANEWASPIKLVENGATGRASFKSIVFKRSSTTPSTPTGGSYASPVPSGWSDGIPSGELQLWMTTRVFTTDGEAPQESAWTTPSAATDTATLDFEYSAVETNPGTPTTAASNWHNSPTSSDIWMAQRVKANGVYGSWSVMKIKGEKGETGNSGQSTFKSIVFKRTSSTPTTPTGGSYSSPVPSGWSDGVPEGEAQLWMSTRVFTSDGQSPQGSTWTTPQKATDTSDIDFEYSSVETNPGNPTDNPSNWHNAATGSDIWMAERTCKNGAWGSWNINKIKGEPGEAGSSIEVQFSADGSTNWHSDFQSGDKYMRERIGSGAWGSAIKIVGENGQDGEDGSYTSFVFKNSDSLPDTPSGTAPIPSGWSDQPPVCDIISPTFEGNWDVHGKTLVSNQIGHSAQSWEKIIFTTTKANTIVMLRIVASSEANYDIGYICNLDTAYSTSTGHYLTKVSGTQSDIVAITVPSAGQHYIYVGYVKDGSTVSNEDKVTVFVLDAPRTWMSKATVADGVAGSWSTPVLLGSSGSDGTNGNDGYNCATVQLFKRASSTPSAPSDTITYTFATGAISGSLDGWSKTIPAANGNPCYVIQATAISQGSTDTIASSEWSSPVVYVEDGESISVQYSADGSSWHSTYQSGDLFMRIKEAGSWGSAMRIKGETGQTGADGSKAPYHDFTFAISSAATGNPPSDISSWADTPPAVTSSKPYLWCRDRYYIVNSSNAWTLSSTSYMRLTGEKGADGEDGDNGNLTKHQWAKTLTTATPAESAWKNTFSEVADHYGYYLWQRILESTNGGVTWNVNANTVGIILDPTVSKEEAEAIEALNEAARQTTAEKLGYSSWSEFSAAVAASSVLIQGGYINASLINTELLIAKVVKTAMARHRVEIADNEMSIFDDDENLIARMHGNYHSSINDFVSTSGSQSSVNFMPTEHTASGTDERTGYEYISEIYSEYDSENDVYTGNSFTITNTGISRVKGRIKAYLNSYYDTISGIEQYSISSSQVGAMFYLSTSPSQNTYAAYLGYVSAYSRDSMVAATKYLDFSATLPNGTYYVWVAFSGNASLIVQSAYSRINYDVIFECSVRSQQNAAATVALIAEKLEIFANGMGYRYSSSDYAALLRTGSSKSSSGYLQAEICAGLAGLRIGQNGLGSYLEGKVGNSFFSLVPKVMAKFLWNSSSSTYTLAKYMVRGSSGGATPYTVKEDRGVVFNMPSDTSETFSDYDIYIATCQVLSNGNMIAAEVQRMSTTQIRIYSPNAGSNWERCHLSLIVW